MATYGHLKTSAIVERSGRKCCGFSARFIDYFLFIFNFIFFISGVLILLLTLVYGRVWIDLGETHLNAIRSFISITHLVNLIHYSMMICGSAICLISLTNGIIGCYDSSNTSADDTIDYESEMVLTPQTHRNQSASQSRNNQYNRRSNVNALREKQKQHKQSQNRPSVILCVFIFALLFLFTLQLIIGMVAFISVTPNSEDKDEFMTSLSENLNISELLSRNELELSSLYQHFKCCGWNSYDDYERPNKSIPVPDSCCKTVTTGCGVRKHPSNIYYDGCIDKFGPILKEYTLILGSVALGFSIVEVFGLIFSCCLYVQTISIN